MGAVDPPIRADMTFIRAKDKTFVRDHSGKTGFDPPNGCWPVRRCESLEMDSKGRIIEVVLGTEFSDYDRRMGDNRTRPKTGAGSSHRKSVQAPIRFVILHSVYDSLDQRATASERIG